jgi:hypothetical protein
MRFLYAFVLVVLGCGGSPSEQGNPGSGGSGTDPTFVVDEELKSKFIALGFPEPVAKFFAAAKLEVIEAGNGKYHFRQTFPNGATRDLTFTYTDIPPFAPTPEQIADAAAVGNTIYTQSFSITPPGTEPVEIHSEYVLPLSAMSDEFKNALLANPAASTETQSTSFGLGDGDAGVIVTEVVKEGAEAGFGEIFDYFKQQGIPLQHGLGENFGNLFSLLSAISDVMAATDLSAEHAKKQHQLDTLLHCALNPTNPLALSDPNYSQNAGNQVSGAKSELKQVTAARYLNMLTDTAAGFNPFLAVILKGGIAHNEQTLKHYTDNTILREANKAVIQCDIPFEAVLTFEYSNKYNQCDNICHDYTETMSAQVKFPVQVMFGALSAFGTPPDGKISSLSDKNLTDSAGSNPNYQISQKISAEGVPEILGQGMMQPNNTYSFSVEATTDVDTTMTTVWQTNSGPSTDTVNVNVYLWVVCEFEGITMTGGDFQGKVTQLSPFDIHEPPPTASSSCKVSLTPVLPPQ